MEIKQAIEILKEGLQFDEIDGEYGIYGRSVKQAYTLALHALEEKQQREETGGWISVEDSLPPEHDSIFAKLYGTEKWDKYMWRKTSGEVNVIRKYDDGSKIVTSGHTQDGVFVENFKLKKSKVTHWQPLPKLSKK